MRTPNLSPIIIHLHPHASPEVAVAQAIMGILRRAFPVPTATKMGGVDPRAIEAHGPGLARVLEKVYADITKTKRAAKIRVRYEDGGVHIEVLNTPKIIIPGVN